MIIKNYGKPFYEADKGGAGTGGNADDLNPNGTGEGNTGASGTTPEGADKTFTQADVDALIKDRLAREKRKADEKAELAKKEADRIALEEQGKFKEIAENLQKELDAEKGRTFEAKKQALLLTAGYTQEQAERYTKFIEGTTAEELATALETFKLDVPPTQAPKGVDPQTKGNGAPNVPAQTKPYDYGKGVIERLKASGSLR